MLIMYPITTVWNAPQRERLRALFLVIQIAYKDEHKAKWRVSSKEDMQRTTERTTIRQTRGLLSMVKRSFAMVIEKISDF